MDQDRRRVLQSLLIGTAGLAVGRTMGAPPPRAGKPSGGSVVARAKRSGMADDKGAIDFAKQREAAGAAIAKAVGEKGPVEAFRRLYKPQDVVGIKINTLGGKGISPEPAFVYGLAAWLQEAGVPARNIVVFDLREPHLLKVGYAPGSSEGGVRCVAIKEDFEKTPREWGPGASCFARILAEEITALLSVAVLKDHGLSGVSIALKQWYGVIHNPNKYHDDGCQPYIAHLAAFPLVRDKLRLTVVDAAVAQCHGGPGRAPRWAWPYAGFLASTDPVAVDAVARDVLEARRKEVGLPPLAAEGREPRYIAGAARLGLGVADPQRIEKVEV